MEMLNRLVGDALDAQRMIDKLVEKRHGETDASLRTGENRAQRRERERREKSAAKRLAKARP